MGVEDKISELDAKWRNYLAKIMGMDPSGTFHVAQGTLGLSAADSSGLFNMADAVPPDSATGYYDPSSMNRRSAAYRGLLFALQSESASDLRDALGDMYTKWLGFKAKWYDDIEHALDPQLKVFAAFANRQLDPIAAEKAIAVFKKASLAPLNHAIDEYQDAKNRQEFTDSAGNTYSLYKYIPSIDNAKKAINTGASVDLDFRASKEDSRLAHTFAQGAASGFYSIFSGKAGVSFEQLNTKAATSDITIKGHIDKYANISAGPVGWYDSNEVKRGYNNKDDFNVWDSEASQNWDDFFKQPNGSLARYITQFLLVSGYELTVTIHASFSSEEYNQIKTRATFGIWPFFSVAATATHTTDHKHNEDGSLSYTTTLPKGLIQIWGVSFQNAP
jgi:hypothetical protein